MVKTKQLHYLFVLIWYPITILHFIFGNYTDDEFILGIVFYSITAFIYVGLVYLFNVSEVGEKIVTWILTFISLILIIGCFMTLNKVPEIDFLLKIIL